MQPLPGKRKIIIIIVIIIIIKVESFTGHKPSGKGLHFKMNPFSSKHKWHVVKWHRISVAENKTAINSDAEVCVSKGLSFFILLSLHSLLSIHNVLKMPSATLPSTTAFRSR